MTELVIGLALGSVPGFLFGRWLSDFQRGTHEARQAMRRRSAHRK